MASNGIESVGAVVVILLGDFNPLILQPAWLRAHDLIDDIDQEYALKEEDRRMVVTGEFTGAQFPWAVIEATRESCRLFSRPATETPDRIRDLTIGIFGLLSHTPIEDVAIAFSWHLALPQERWDTLSERLAPAGPLQGLLEHPALESVEHTSERADGQTTIVVEPSHKDGFTAYVSVEDSLSIAKGPDSARQALSALDARWEEVRSRAENIMTELTKP